MKRIVEGKLYDTETATYVAEYKYGGAGNSHHLYETLYRSPKGRFFIEYYGGPLSQYAERQGSQINGTSGIRTLDNDHEILNWCESRRIIPEAIAPYLTIEPG